MKIEHIYNGWSVTGRRVHVIFAGQYVDREAMEKYYHLRPGDRDYAQCLKPAKFDRWVIEKPDGRFTIVPMNFNLYRVYPNHDEERTGSTRV